VWDTNHPLLRIRRHLADITGVSRVAVGNEGLNPNVGTSDRLIVETTTSEAKLYEHGLTEPFMRRLEVG
jgi:hypothetical protein